MNKNRKTMLSAIVLSSAIGLTVGPTWSQQTTAPGAKGDRPGATQKDDAVRQQDKPGTAAGQKMGAPAQERQKYSQETVREVQQALKEKGHDPGPIDGVMGPNTRQALRAFQKEENLKGTGTLDQDTAQKLGVKLNDRAPGAGAGDMPRTKSPGQTKGGDATPQQKRQ